MATITVLAFDAKGRPIEFESWLEDYTYTCRVSPRTTLTLASLETRLLEAETCARAVAASRGTPSSSFFDWCTPSLQASSVASDAAVDFLGAKKVGAASAPSGGHNRGGDKRSGGGGVGGGGGGGGGSGGDGGGRGGRGGGGGGRGRAVWGGGTGATSSGAASGGAADGGVGSGGGLQQQQQPRQQETPSPQ
ncbi:unnamed protein product [Closterium sp. NIES-54]